MTLIKLLLITAVVVIGILALRGSRKAIHKVVWRAYVVLVVVAAGLAVLFPDALTELANVLGIGRGADLVLYTFVVTFMLVTVVIFRRLETLERRYTQLVRTVAIRDPLLGAPDNGEDET